MTYDSKLVGFSLLLLALGGCQRAAASSQNHPSDGSPLLAKVGSRVLTVAGAQSDVDRLPLEERVRFTTSPAQHEFVQKLVDQEILAAEAAKLGYDRAPEVLAAAKRAMVVKLLKERIGNGPKPGEVSIEVAQKYYEEHPQEFGPPEKARVALLMVKDPARARSIRDEAEQAVRQAASRGLEVEQQVFRELVAKYSDEPGARDVTISIGLTSSSYPAAVNAGAAALNNPGDLSPVIEADGAAYILQLEERTPASVLPFEQVKDHALRAASEQLRDRKVQALITELAAQHHAEIHPERFSAVHFDPDPYMQAAATPVARRPRGSTPPASPE